MLKKIMSALIRRSENQFGVKFEYIHKIAQTDLGLLFRYNRIFGFINPNKKVPPLAYHAARLRGALAADCGTCVETEIKLAKLANIDSDVISELLSGQLDKLSPEIAAVVSLSDAVTRERRDEPAAREIIKSTWGDAGVIELGFAMNGAALLPGIKRSMGYSGSCDISLLQQASKGI